MIIKNYCKNCDKRHPYCHIRCESYLKYKQQRGFVNDKRREDAVKYHPRLFNTYSIRRKGDT